MDCPNVSVAAAPPALPAAATVPAALRGPRPRGYTIEEQAVMHELNLSTLTYVMGQRTQSGLSWRVQLGGREGLNFAHVSVYDDLRTAIRERDLAVLAVHGRKDANPAAPATLLLASSYSEQEVAATAAKLQKKFKDKADVLALMSRHPSWPGAGRQAAAPSTSG